MQTTTVPTAMQYKVVFADPARQLSFTLRSQANAESTDSEIREKFVRVAIDGATGFINLSCYTNA